VPSERLLDRMNVAFWLVRRGRNSFSSAARSRGYELIYQDPLVQLFRRKTYPRHLFTTEYRVVNEAGALRELEEGPAAEVLLENTPSFPYARNRPHDPQPRVHSAGLNFETLVMDAPRAGFIAVSESYFAGWRAFVNGRPARIVRANYAFRGVEVPAGRSVVVFRYWPPGLTAGLFISGLAAAGTAYLLILRRD
jgi:hypothetical protein